MAIYSPLRSRRLAAQQAEETERIITFQLREETFALQLNRVNQVTTLGRLYGDANDTGVSLTTYQGQELVVIDVGQQIFGQAPTVEPPAERDVEKVRYLLILQRENGQLVGFPIDSPPSIQSVAMSAFRPLPDIYRQHSNIHCVSCLSIDQPDRPAIFLLDATLILNN